MQIDTFTIVLLTLCGTQAYTWYKYKKFEALTSFQILNIIGMYGSKLLELTDEIDKLKQELSKHEQQTKTPSN